MKNRGRKISFIPGRVGSIAGKWRDASHSLEKVCGAIARKGIDAIHTLEEAFGPIAGKRSDASHSLIKEVRGSIAGKRRGGWSSTSFCPAPSIPLDRRHGMRRDEHGYT